MNNGIFMRPAKDGGFIVSNSDIMQSIGGGFGMPEPLFAGELTPCLAYLERTFTPKAEVVEPVVSEWLTWNGGPKSVSDQFLVEAILRSGQKLIKMSEDLDWHHDADSDDIVSYRLLPTERP